MPSLIALLQLRVVGTTPTLAVRYSALDLLYLAWCHLFHPYAELFRCALVADFLIDPGEVAESRHGTVNQGRLNILFYKVCNQLCHAD